MGYKVYENINRRNLYVLREGYVEPLSLTRWTANNPYSSTRITTSGEVDPHDGYFTALGVPAYARNNAIRKFYDQVREGSTAQVGVAAAEWKSSLTMVANRSDTLRHAWDSLTLKPRRRGRRKAVRPSQLWLEYWMGWAPLVGDIFNALDIIQRPHPYPYKIRGGKRFNDSRRDIYDAGIAGFRFRQVSWEGNISFFGEARVTNHNLHRLDQLGLVNPALAAFQLARFSFILNWFVNVEQVLDSLIPFAGVSLSKMGEASMQVGSGTMFERYRQYDYDLGQYVDRYRQGSASVKYLRRAPTGVPKPQLTLHFDRLSLTRAATSVSLLVEALKRN